MARPAAVDFVISPAFNLCRGPDPSNDRRPPLQVELVQNSVNPFRTSGSFGKPRSHNSFPFLCSYTQSSPAFF
jgi:hypothetical protein